MSASGPASSPVSFTDVFSSALRGAPCHVVGLAHEPHLLPVATWSRPVDAGDETVLGHCVGATLDVGCGPGRMTVGLADRGHVVLGIDLVEEAVRLTRRRGALALRRDVFGAVPGEGRWSTVLLADGNIGIGGDPAALLRRAAQLVHPRGRVVVDLAAPGVGLQTREVRLETSALSCRPFRWSLVAPEAVGRVAHRTGLHADAVRRCGDRWFAVLVAEGS